MRVAAALLVLHGGMVFGQFHHRAKAARVAPSMSMTFMKRDGSCVDGPIAKIEPKVVTVRAQRCMSVFGSVNGAVSRPAGGTYQNRRRAPLGDAVKDFPS